ncbi:MAG: hypothetical protein M1814_005720 [Vezdaea aestivalis]|nr:MAG: hypothetical protein M1814_005720 [Vezdaea aestivalis]
MQRPYFVPHDVNSTVVIETAEDRTPSPVKETVFGNSNRSAESDQLSMSKTQEASYRTGADLMYSPTLSIYNCYHATNGHESEKKTSGPLLSPDSDIDSDQDNFFSIERKSFLPENASPIHGLRTKDLSFPVGSGREGHTPLWSPADSTNFALTDPPQTWIGSRASWIQGPRDQPSEASVRKSILQLRRMDSEAARWKSSTASKMYLSMGQLRNVSPSACASGTGGEESVYENVYARSPALESTEFRRAESKRRKAAVKLYNRSRSDSMYDKDGFLKV